MRPSPPPEIEILGVYSPSASAEQYEACVAEYAASCDPANLSPRMRELFVQVGRDTEPFTADELREAGAPIRPALLDAVYIEVLVRDVRPEFDVNDFCQPDPTLPEDQAQVAWNPTFLSSDGEVALSGYPHSQAPDETPLRIVFVIHCWKPELPLASSYGPLPCLKPLPLPERLWRLVPYETVD